MKFSAAFVLILLVAVQSHAQLKKAYQRTKQAVMGSAKLAELHYFPEQWEADLSLGYRYTSLDVKGTSAGLSVVEASQKQHLLKSSLALGVLDNLYVQFTWNYLASMETIYSKPAATPNLKSNGFEDPTFIGVVRLLDGSLVKLDTLLAFQPTTGDHLEPDSSHNGDAKSGGHTVTLGAKLVALVTENSQVSVVADYRMMSLQNSIDQTTSEVTEAEQHNGSLIEIATLTALTTDLYFGVLLEMTNISSYKETNLTTQAKTTNGSVSGKALNVVGKYLLTHDSLIELQAGYVIDYSGSANSIGVSATGYSANINYTVRF